jgi:alcohol dehydrogenase class IV
MARINYLTSIEFGAGALATLTETVEEFRLNRPLLVADRGVLAAGLVAEALAHLPAETPVFLDTPPNPTESAVIAALEQYRGEGCDGIVAIGGGSALDAGKAARLLVKRPDFNLANFYNETDWSDLVPLIAIPTTAGTGSEVGRSSVITLAGTKRKAVLFHAELLARSVILDPELTRGLPPKLTAATGADALTHCIESFTCPVFHPMCDGIALEGIRLIVGSLPRAYANGNDLEARGHMLMAAAMGAVAFQKDLGVVHSLAHPLSTLCGMHHGLANALCLVAGLNFCARRKPGLYRRVGVACGLEVMRVPDAEADHSTIAFLKRFLADLGLQGRLRDHGANPELLDALVAQAAEDPCHTTNAVPVSREDLRELYLEVL